MTVRPLGRDGVGADEGDVDHPRLLVGQGRVRVEPAGLAGLAATVGTRAEPAQRREVVAGRVAVLPDDVERAGTAIGRAATKAERYVGEMREIAATQEAAGLPRVLFDGFAELYAAFSCSELAAATPESIGADASLEDVLVALAPAR